MSLICFSVIFFIENSEWGMNLWENNQKIEDYCQSSNSKTNADRNTYYNKGNFQKIETEKPLHTVCKV